ncbi:protein GL2-INTERACTING REPRESSOR 2-like [Impatiens glandulifera]|uniref:protein GL2-INTERACTING REPRESSOR 2-like n=1 Tax=Impatiens glandulifera TaxID=253017 RepID=UPI001FB0BBAE|nr:protein GL2-INTERACTING REPRESSOR 2-like [Impatiens glandulifera]
MGLSFSVRGLGALGPKIGMFDPKMDRNDGTNSNLMFNLIGRRQMHASSRPVGATNQSGSESTPTPIQNIPVANLHQSNCVQMEVPITLSVVGCKTCLAYFMVPDKNDCCPKCKNPKLVDCTVSAAATSTTTVEKIDS